MESESTPGARRPEPRPAPDAEQGGEPACLPALLCPACDAVPDEPAQAVCRRCGADLHPA
ncbi:hypothetical protein [Kitasatospora sp. NPDC059571]|uniref:hypothetical protein n=1 Tax=Kitasatospora sp. NPDC059571 TaxID=3346871 RepID=UPI0036B87334